MIIKKYFRREGGKIYKYARVTYHYSPKSAKAVKREMEGYKLMEGYNFGTNKLQEIYRREFNDFRS